MGYTVTKKQLENLVFGPVSLDYVKQSLDFVPAYNSITYVEVNKKGPGILPDSLINTVPVVIRRANGDVTIEKDTVGSKETWKHCDETGDIFYGQGNVAPHAKGQPDDLYDEYDDDEQYTGARVVKIPKKQHYY